MNALVQFWKDYSPPQGRAKEVPRLHPSDAEYLGSDWPTFGRAGSMWDHLNAKVPVPVDHFHLSLEPLPFVGNLEKADIVILMLNPRFVLSEYYAHDDPGYRSALRRTLAQDFDGCQFPFFWLDPELCWCDGFVYWEQRLREVLEKWAKKKRFEYGQALREASRRIALIELVPYCSVNFPQGRRARRIVSAPSVKAAKAAAKAAAERARNGQCVVVGRGGYERWGLHQGEGVLIQKPSIRGFSLSLKSDLGLGSLVYRQLCRDVG